MKYKILKGQKGTVLNPRMVAGTKNKDSRIS